MTPRSTAASGAGSGDGPAPLLRLRPLLVALCAGQAVAAAIALVVVTASPGSHAADGARPLGGAGASARAPRVAAVQAMLDRHGADVLDRDRAGFLADLDTSSASASYRAAQAAMFDNLAQVPLAAWTYQVSAPVTGGSVIAQTSARYRADVLIARVSLRYQLRDADPAPTGHDLWLTFVQRGGHVRIASDTDLAGEGGASWRGPWDFGPVVARRGASSLVLAHPGNEARLGGLATLADDAVAAVTRAWGDDWGRRVVVVVPGSAGEMRAVLGTAPGSDPAADTVGDPENPSTGLRVVLNPADFTRLSLLGLRIVLRHEVTHVATWALTTAGQAMPTWLVEGFADYVGNLGTGQPVTLAAGELRADVRAGRVPAALPTNQQWSAAGSRVPQVYEEGWLACRLIASSAGQSALVRFYRQVARSASTTEAAVDSALRDVVHLDAAQFTARWRQYLRTELG